MRLLFPPGSLWLFFFGLSAAHFRGIRFDCNRGFCQVLTIFIFSSHGVISGWSKRFFRRLPVSVGYTDFILLFQFSFLFFFGLLTLFRLALMSALLHVFCFGWRGQSSVKTAPFHCWVRLVDRVFRSFIDLDSFVDSLELLSELFVVYGVMFLVRDI